MTLSKHNKNETGKKMKNETDDHETNGKWLENDAAEMTSISDERYMRVCACGGEATKNNIT